VPPVRRLRPRGIDPDARYRLTPWPEPDDRSVLDGADVRGGDELMGIGFVPSAFLRDSGGLGDFTARLFVLEAVGANT
jgi:Glycosyl hydrolase family 36 C-terminal domain